jgi:hypothetical protein
MSVDFQPLKEGSSFIFFGLVVKDKKKESKSQLFNLVVHRMVYLKIEK